MTHLGLDVGTSSVKALLVDAAQRVLAVGTAPLTVDRPHPLWSEQDPHAWWTATQAAVAQVRAAAPAAWAALATIGLSGQQHGATLLDHAGRVLRPAILWNDGRSGQECADLLRDVPDFTRRSGNTAFPGFTSPKLLWLSRHEPETFAATRMVLLPKDYVRYRMTGAYVSDLSDSSGTLWLDVAARAWDDTLLAATHMTRAQMPALVEGAAISATLSAAVASDWGVARIPVAGGGGDNACSATGVGAVRTGEGFLSLGTSGVLFSTSDHYVTAPERTLHAFCHALPGRWHGMAVVLSAASAVSWIADIVGQPDIAALLARVATWATPAAREHAPLFLPYLTGERTPHNDPGATGLFADLRAGHGADAMAYAVLEGVAFALADNLDVLVQAGAPITHCMMVGGGARSRLWGQMLADILGLTLHLPEGAETGAALGAARLGMLAGGGREADICTRPPVRESFLPDPGASHAPRLARYRALYPAERAARA